jgi:hypothetical protein
VRRRRAGVWKARPARAPACARPLTLHSRRVQGEGGGGGWQRCALRRSGVTGPDTLSALIVGEVDSAAAGEVDSEAAGGSLRPRWSLRLPPPRCVLVTRRAETRPRGGGGGGVRAVLHTPTPTARRRAAAHAASAGLRRATRGGAGAGRGGGGGRMRAKRGPRSAARRCSQALQRPPSPPAVQPAWARAKRRRSAGGAARSDIKRCDRHAQLARGGAATMCATVCNGV